MTDVERIANLTERVARLEAAAGYTPAQVDRFHSPPRANPQEAAPAGGSDKDTPPPKDKTA